MRVEQSGAKQRQIGDDYVLGVWSGDQGVEYVRMYKLVK